MQTPLFPPTFRELSGHRRRCQVVTCSDCGREKAWPVSVKAKGGMATDTIIRKTREIGWTFTKRGKVAVCKECDELPKSLAAVRGLQTRPDELAKVWGDVEDGGDFETAADITRTRTILEMGLPSLESLEEHFEKSGTGEALDSIKFKPEEEDTDMASTQTAVAEQSAPRQPEREDKRRILAKLDDVCCSEEVGYSGNWSDEKVAATLSVPPAWVRDLREEFHGDNASNEDSDKVNRERTKALNECRADVKRIESTLTNTLARAESDLTAVRKRLEKLESST